MTDAAQIIAALDVLARASFTPGARPTTATDSVSAACYFLAEKQGRVRLRVFMRASVSCTQVAAAVRSGVLAVKLEAT